MKLSLLLYLVVFILFFHAYFGGQVVSPNLWNRSIGASIEEGAAEYPKFGDFNSSYIPEVSEHLSGKRSGWATLWSPHSEFGRGLYHLGGYSPAYLPSLIISLFTKDPWVFLTALSVGACFLTGIFVLLFCGELGINPLASLIAGLSLALSPFNVYWLTFPMFLGWWCWFFGILWGLRLLYRNCHMAGGLVVAFSVYSLFMTVYPQLIVYCGYMGGGYCAILSVGAMQKSGRQGAAFVAAVILAVLTGVIAALPIYLDLWAVARDSARAAAPLSFFTRSLPSLASWQEWWAFIATLFSPHFFGNPIDPSYPLRYEALSVPVPVLFFALIGMMACFSTNAWWIVVIAVGFLLTICPSLFVFAVTYGGLNLSRSTPLGICLGPFVILMAWGIHVFLREEGTLRMKKAAGIAGFLCLAFVIATVLYGLAQGLHLSAGSIALDVMIVLALLIPWKRARGSVVLACALLAIATTSYPLMLHLDRSVMRSSSPLIDKIRDMLPKDGRYAIVGAGLEVLTPNVNTTLQVSSVHSHNSLSSQAYHSWIRQLGGSVTTHGRWSREVNPDYNGLQFWMSNIAVVLSRTALHDSSLHLEGHVDGVNIFRSSSRMGRCVQVPYEYVAEVLAQEIIDPRQMSYMPCMKEIDRGDEVEFSVSPNVAGLVVLSQQYHPHWRASYFAGGAWHPTDSVQVNKFFQGATVPRGAVRIQFAFRPWAHSALWVNVLWLVGLSGVVICAAFRRGRRLQA